MLKISIVKFENPSCLWGRVVCGSDGDSTTTTTEQYDCLQAQMNLFYHDVTQDQRKLRPVSLEKGTTCVVFWSVRKSWCRAVVESIIADSVSCKARCLLVDHGERLVVSSDQIRVAVQDFLQLPFWVRKFHLARIKPTTLRVSLYKMKAELIPSAQWDSSATLYLHHLLKVSIRTEAVLLESESDSTSIELYLTLSNIKICVNDDLVAKKFALYVGAVADSSGPDEVDPFPVMLPSSVLTLSSTSHRSAAETRPPSVTSQDLASADWPTAPPPQSQPHDEGSWVTEDTQSADGQSKGKSDSVVTDSDTLDEDTDSSLAADLTKSLGLFRLMNFLNPESSFQQEAPSLNRCEEMRDCGPSETTAASRAGQESGVVCQENKAEQTRYAGRGHPVTSMFPPPSVRPEVEAEETRISEEDWACSRLLAWLNPEPPTTEADQTPPECPQVGSSDPILVHSALPVEPCTSLDDAPIAGHLSGMLQRKQYGSLSPADRYSWPAVARGCNTVIISQNASQPLCYLTPLLTHILLNSIFTCLSSSIGPIAVLLCPGWERVQVVYDLLEVLKVTSSLHPTIVLLGVGKDEGKAVKIPKNCLLLVTTPFSLVRLLSCQCFLFLRLYHLVLDQADQLFTLAPEQMATILQHFQKVNSCEEKSSCPQQIVAVAKRWTDHMDNLLTNHMPFPCVVVSVPEEAVLYANVQQVVLMSLETSKVSVLLAALDFNPDVGQKTLIVTSSAQEVEDVFKAVGNRSAFCLMIHEGLTHQIDFVIQQWRKDIGPGTHVILVTTNECLKCLGIRDASCVVHYSFPSSPKAFGSRLFCMVENFRNLSERDQTDSCSPLSRSVLIISDRNARHIVGLMRYLVRTNTTLPSELLTFAEGLHVAQEDRKTSRPLCSYLKSFGVCRDSSKCPDRHRVLSHLDQSVLPASGVIEVVPLYIKTASIFSGRLVRKDNDFQSIASEMSCYYAEKKPAANDVVEGGLYAVQEDKVFHRVKVLSVPERSDRLFFSVFVRFIDVGKEEEVRSHQILNLPQQFHSLPAQAVEIIVCRVQPVDGEANWHPKVTRAISQKIRGLQHRARAVLSLGNTVFVDPMVRLSQMPGMKTVINEYNVHSEILNTGMGISNPDHLNLLKALCQETTHLPGSGDGQASLDVLTEAFSHLADPPLLEPCEPDSPVSSAIQSMLSPPPVAPATETRLVPVCAQMALPANQSTTGQTNGHAGLLSSADNNMRNRPEGELCPSPTSTLINGEDRSSQQVKSDTDGHTSFHPQVRWYQTSDSVIVTVKLTNPEAQRCDFYPDRVVYSGRVDGRTYGTDLQLQRRISADRCSWEMKSNEPVLKLVKEEGGLWERLVRNKSIFVSYDLEHVEEEEDKTPNDLWFLENTGEHNWFVNSESDSDSD